MQSGAREELLKEMLSVGMATYLQDLRGLLETIRSVFSKPDNFMDDELWQKTWTFGTNRFWWQSRSPYLQQLFTRKTFLHVTSKLSVPLALLMNKFVVDLFVTTPASVPVQQVILFKTVLSSYFQESEVLWPVFLNIDYTFDHLKKEEGAALLHRTLLAAVAGTGPMILKVMQSLNTSAKDEAIRGVNVKKLTSTVLHSVPALSETEFRLVQDSLALPEITKASMVLQALGSGSIAESHLATWENKEVVVKFIKPMYLFYFLCEIDMLLHRTWGQLSSAARKATSNEKESSRWIRQTRQILLFLIQEYGREFFYEDEARFTEHGHRIYDRPSLHLRSVQCYHFAPDPVPVLVLQKAPGKPLEKLAETLPKPKLQTLTKALHALAQVWMINLFWGDGFFHADLHAGNLLLDENLENIWLIDFGSCGQLTPQMQCCLLDAVMLPGAATDLSSLIPPRHVDDLGTGLKVEPTNISRFFAVFAKLTPTQQALLNRATKQEMIHDQHARNLQIVRQFIRIIWHVCEVQNKDFDELDTLAQRVLDYSQPLEFGMLFLRIVRFGNDIGSCAFNQTLMFGRAIRFVTQIIWDTESLCGDLCAPWDLVAQLRSALVRNPQLLLRQKFTCKRFCRNLV